MIIKNTDPYKLKKCIICKKDIQMQEKYFTYPLSLQNICLECSVKEIPKIIEALGIDLQKTRELLKTDKNIVE
jgi:benzoyl-CoA reductase/2-hydroxyglutaryl-CoA dehydratase subunit BcrC/BadD/HgdB